MELDPFVNTIRVNPIRALPSLRSTCPPQRVLAFPIRFVIPPYHPSRLFEPAALLSTNPTPCGGLPATASRRHVLAIAGACLVLDPDSHVETRCLHLQHALCARRAWRDESIRAQVQYMKHIAGRVLWLSLGAALPRRPGQCRWHAQGGGEWQRYLFAAMRRGLSTAAVKNVPNHPLPERKRARFAAVAPAEIASSP